jgi:hypothetical protein
MADAAGRMDAAGSDADGVSCRESARESNAAVAPRSNSTVNFILG